MTINKKVMTAAVAAALVAPAAAFAQASNVQIYGTFAFSGEQRNASGQDISLAPATGGSSVRGGGLGSAYATATAPIPTLSSRTATQSAGSNFGIRGREDLGNGMYAGFQIEISDSVMSAGPAGATTGGNTIATYRNTGVWVGGRGFGEIGMGMWDTPFNQVQNALGPMHANYGGPSTSMVAGFLGTSPVGNAGTVVQSGQTISQVCAPNSNNIQAANNANGFATAATPAIAGNYPGGTITNCYQAGANFARRAYSAVWWNSPNWSGFQFKGMVTTQNQDYNAANTFVGTSAANVNELKPMLWSLNAGYANGPLSLMLGYENHRDMVASALRAQNGIGALGAPAAIAVGGLGTTAVAINTSLLAAGSGITGSQDTAWNFQGRYNFGQFTVGAYWESLTWKNTFQNTAAAGAAGNLTKLVKTGYRLDGAWQGGPHTVGVQYGKNNAATGGTDNGNTFDGTGTGANNWIFGYAYSLSKRTNLVGYHVRTNNDTNARYNGIVFGGLSPSAGADPRYTGIGIRHSF